MNLIVIKLNNIFNDTFNIIIETKIYNLYNILKANEIEILLLNDIMDNTRYTEIYFNSFYQKPYYEINMDTMTMSIIKFQQ